MGKTLVPVNPGKSFSALVNLLNISKWVTPRPLTVVMVSGENSNAIYTKLMMHIAHCSICEYVVIKLGQNFLDDFDTFLWKIFEQI